MRAPKMAQEKYEMRNNVGVSRRVHEKKESDFLKLFFVQANFFHPSKQNQIQEDSISFLIFWFDSIYRQQEEEIYDLLFPRLQVRFA